MIVALQSGEITLVGVRRIFIEQLEETGKLLQQRALSDRDIHQVRKELKRARATARLLREALGEAAYRRLNRILQNSAKPLTPVRDAKALLDALDNALAYAGKSTRKNRHYDELRHSLERQRRMSRSKVSDQIAGVCAHLKKAAENLKNVPNARLESAAVVTALKRAYKKARKAFKLSERTPDDENLHEWRKQVKYQYHQLELLRLLKPAPIGAAVKRARKLADRLGDDHDLALLQNKIASRYDGSKTSAAVSAKHALLKALRHRRKKLQRKSFRLGRKLYREKTKRIAKRLATL